MKWIKKIIKRLVQTKLLLLKVFLISNAGAFDSSFGFFRTEKKIHTSCTIHQCIRKLFNICSIFQTWIASFRKNFYYFPDLIKCSIPKAIPKVKDISCRNRLVCNFVPSCMSSLLVIDRLGYINKWTFRQICN